MPSLPVPIGVPRSFLVHVWGLHNARLGTHKKSVLPCLLFGAAWCTEVSTRKSVLAGQHEHRNWASLRSQCVAGGACASSTLSPVFATNQPPTLRAGCCWRLHAQCTLRIRAPEDQKAPSQPFHCSTAEVQPPAQQHVHAHAQQLARVPLAGVFCLCTLLVCSTYSHGSTRVCLLQVYSEPIARGHDRDATREDRELGEARET